MGLSKWWYDAVPIDDVVPDVKQDDFPNYEAVLVVALSQVDDLLELALHVDRDSATRGARTMSDAPGVNPATSNSLTLAGKSAAVRFMASAMSSDTMLTTNSPVASTLSSVSLLLEPARRDDEKTMVGGLLATALKKE